MSEDTIEKLKMHTPDFANGNVQKLAELFPNCVTEAKNENGQLKRAIDFDLLRQELSGDVVEGPQERYRLDWPGKREALALANAPIAKTLRPCREESVDFDTTKNLYIEGENLEALKLIKENYLNQIDIVFLDPPYNTGNDFIYNDSFGDNLSSYLLESNQSDDGGNKLVANQEGQGRFHSKWLSMMYSRLKMAWLLLDTGGILAITIDDTELFQTGKVLDEIFGPGSLVTCAPWLSEASGGKAKSGLRIGHEYVLIYAKKELIFSTQTKSNGPLNLSDNKGLYRKGRELMKWGSNSLREDRPTQFFELRRPDGNAVLPYRNDGREGRWRWGKENPCIGEALQNPDFFHWEDTRFDEGVTVAGLNSRMVPYEKIREEEKESLWGSWLGNHGYNADATRELKELFGEKIFDTPKPTTLLKWIINLHPDNEATILDYFSGCGSTAHAVFDLNAQTNGRRRNIMVQVPDHCSDQSPAKLAGFQTISDIGKERIRRAGAKVRQELESQLEGELPGSAKHSEITQKLANLNTGFRVLKVDSSNMADVYYQPDKVIQEDLFAQIENIKPDRTHEDLLFQVLLDWGVELSLPITTETINKQSVLFVDGNALAACFETRISEDLVKEIAKRKPLRAVFRDTGFADDSTKINVVQIFKQLSPETEVRSI